jgi:hypothetical protein
MLVAAALLVSAIVACRPSLDTSRGVSDAFVDAYFVRIDLKTARTLVSGLALNKIDKELELTRHVEIDEETHKPSITYKLTHASEDPAHAQYAYELTIRPPGLEPFGRLAMVTVRDQDGTWRVTNYNVGELPE